MTWDGVERRSKKRYGVKNSAVRYRRGGLTAFLSPVSPKLILLNVSECGCHFITKDPLEPGAKLSIEIEAPKLPKTIAATGRVIWARRSEDVKAFRVGVEFTNMPQRSKVLLKGLLDNAILENVEVSTRVYVRELEKL